MRAQTSATGSEATRSNVVPATWPCGAALGRWRAVELIGRGGTAEVWLGVAADGSRAALKVPTADLRTARHGAAPLRHEHAVLRTVASPQLVRPLELIEHGAVPALVLEYLPGGDLVALAGAPVEHWLPALETVLAGLADLARHGFAHGDIKARNVLFAGDGSARLIDLASVAALASPARVTTAASRVPSPATATAADADAFAGAALVYELVTGRVPYGEAGAPGLGCAPAPAVAPGPAAGRLLSAAEAVLRCGGRPPCGLSYLADVIESVGATDC